MGGRKISHNSQKYFILDTTKKAFTFSSSQLKLSLTIPFLIIFKRSYLRLSNTKVFSVIYNVQTLTPPYKLYISLYHIFSFSNNDVGCIFFNRITNLKKAKLSSSCERIVLLSFYLFYEH